MDALRRALGAIALICALSFVAFALLHSGVALGPVREPVIVPAVVVETVCAVAGLTGAYGALAHRRWAWDGLLYGYAVALGGVTLGILAVALGPGEPRALLLWYHGTTAALLAGGLTGAFYVSRVRR
ncbi:hypothetical protein ACIBP6_28995 [Nonomuraea terrae]|uniref:hypothetical protein n=1 Tax=Nonomuraea terrae TaxID=2530383 RepID=UPI0037A2791F